MTPIEKEVSEISKDIERLMQESNERKRIKQNVWGLWVVVAGLVLRMIFELFKK